MDVVPEHEDLFNEVYDEHARFLLEVPGIRSVTRVKGIPFNIMIGGESKPYDAAKPVYTAIYEIDSPDVLSSPEWAAAVEKGRWPTEIRPHTRNRQHAVYSVLPSTTRI